MAGPSSGEGALICIPTYDEAENIRLITKAVLDRVPDAHILIIDDNSPDGTGQIADELADQTPLIHVLHRPRKEGLGQAYLAGFSWALERDYRFIFEFDADFSHNPDYLPEFIPLLEKHDVVIGSRRVSGGGVQDWGAVRRFISWGGSTYARTILGVPVRDLTGGFNGFRREVLAAIELDTVGSTGYSFQVELKFRCVRRGFDVVEVPIVFPDRVRGKSKMGPHIITEAMMNVVKMRLSRWR